ncbi:MAG: HAD family hydrolase [Bryobacteraceae bacterium]|nr:HAD family hydrolase [Bryobacteraceae bacterium]
MALQHSDSKNGGVRRSGAAIPVFPVYLFDVDGTLVDSAPDICSSIQTILANTSRAEVDHPYLKRFIGYHLIDLFQDLFPEIPNEEADKLVSEYRAVYSARDHAATTLYPGVLETLASLPGRKSTATTKATATTRIVLERFGLLPFFDHVQGTDGFPSKPAPDVILHSIAVFGARPQDCLLVGDSAPDMEAGRRAGVQTCAVRYGYGDLVNMAQWEPDYWIDNLSELLPDTVQTSV